MARGSVTRRGEAWRARFWHPETGKQVQKTFSRQVDAQRWLRDELSALDAGTWIDGNAGKVTLEAYFLAWSQRQVWTDGTQKAMSLAVRSTPFKTLQLRKIQTSHIEVWVKSMTVPTADRRALASGTVRTRFVNVRSVFRAAVRDRLVAADPTVGVKVPKQRKRSEASMPIPDPKQVQALLKAADERFAPFLAVCALAGLRLGEAAALQFGDVDFLRRQIHVRRQVQRASGGKVELRLPKYGSERTIPIPDQLVSILAAHAKLDHRGDWMFAGSEDDPPHQNTIGHRWRTTASSAGVVGFTLHSLRHFYASGLISAGCDVVTVQKALGHAKPSTTLDTYSHLWPSGEDRARKAAASIAAEVLVADVGNLWAEG
jgi:integrase